MSSNRVGEGADQLAEYMSREQSTDWSSSLLGYLAVFDGRRRKVIDSTTRIADDAALYYRDKEVGLPGKHASGQTGIATMVRYFLEPRQSEFAAPV